MERQVAVLIDGDNLSPKYAQYIKEEAVAYGRIKVFRLYGSVSSPTTLAWYRVMPEQGIAPMLQLSYVHGKSIADQALTIDAMDLLHTDNLDVFCIASSDSDYIKLMYRLKEAGKLVIGMGEQKAIESLAKACDEFKILDVIYQAVGENAEAALPEDKREAAPAMGEAPDAEDREKIIIPEKQEILDAIDDFISASEEGRVHLSTLGSFLKCRFPGFDTRNYAYKNMTKLLEDHADRFELIREATKDGMNQVNYVSKAKRA